ncbi:MAG TPA: CHAT domain-containing protein [Pyrinomonadaceae bacterium]|jgi:hypothetical protein
MSRQQSTVILFLLDKNGIPELQGESYLCSLIETPQARSFSPTEFTFNCSDIRDNIIKQIKKFADSNMSNHKSFREIGEAIWVDLGIASFFEHLAISENDVTFLTNDPAIPWEWASSCKGETLCQQISCGNVFFEQMKEAASEAKKQTFVKSFDERIKKTKALLLFDEGNKSNGFLSEVRDEIREVKEVLLNSGIKKDNIKIVDGTKKGAEASFLRYIRQMRDDLGIIHFAGHIENGNMSLKHSSIESREIYGIFSTVQTKLPRTLVFINGCESGNVPDVWDKSKNLATAWLFAGASNIIGCRLPVYNGEAKKFAAAFYSQLLDKMNVYASIGNVLKDTRNELMGKSKFDPAWLQYTLFGLPNIQFFDMKEEAELVKTSMSEAIESNSLSELFKES